MAYRISVDTGGTFSDVVLTDDRGTLSVSKAPTTPDRIFRGISAALEYAAQDRGLTLAGLLADTSVFIYGTTRSTNAILSGGTARTAFLTTEGFPDTLVLREGGKPNPYDFRQPYPQPYVPRRLTFEIRERVTGEGEILVPLDEEHARGVIGRLAGLGVEAVAVGLLWSIAEPAHERRLGELLDELLPGIPYTLGHELNPIVREYRRASSTAIDASLKPLMQRHLGEMADDLRAAGFAGELLVVTSFGGVLGVEDVSARPIYSVASGPSMAPVAGKVYAEGRDAIVCDMGGTSFDVSLVRDGYIKFTRETWLGPRWTGHMTGLSSVEVSSIGAGGGSIAWIDPGGLLRVGPRSAGSTPGPACYGQGGTEPTVSDAALVLGYLDPDYFLGGRIALSRELSEEAIRTRVAEPLGLSVERAAWSIMAVANEHMVSAIRDITINEGLDPRRSVIVSGGGAGGMAIGAIAGQLGCDHVLVPRTAAALSACGGQLSDVVTEFSASCRADTRRFDREAVHAALASLDERMEAFFARLGADPSQRRKELFVEARYPYQVWELDVPLPVERFDADADVAALADAFHRVHERVFAVSEPGQHVECINWKGRASVSLPKPSIPRTDALSSEPPRPRTTRSAVFAEGAVPTPVYYAEDLAPGQSFRGPAILAEPTTTIVVYPGWSARVTETGDYALARERSEP